jgi:hypothetical protein
LIPENSKTKNKKHLFNSEKNILKKKHHSKKTHQKPNQPILSYANQNAFFRNFLPIQIDQTRASGDLQTSGSRLQAIKVGAI